MKIISEQKQFYSKNQQQWTRLMIRKELTPLSICAQNLHQAELSRKNLKNKNKKLKTLYFPLL